MAKLHLLVLVLCCVVAVPGLAGQQVSDDSEAAKTKLAEYIAKKRLDINPRWRPQYHVAPPVGWMNDPNGFSFYKDQYHVFYQLYPYDITTGPIHWGHSTSTNLVDWTEQPTALLPGKEQCFSGSGVVDGDQLVLMYTAHEILNATITSYNETQYLAMSTDGVNFKKYEGNPVLPSAPNGSPDFRDPKVWKHENYWYVVIGSKTDNLQGRVLLYRSPDLKSWDFLSVIGESNGTMGYMWECPDFFELDGKFILLMSPQGLEPQGDRYKNTFQTGYIIGSFNYTTFEFVHEVEFQELDFGHDFYATQTIDDSGKRYVIGWFGMWDVPHPEAVDGWAGTLTIIRELRLDGDRLLQIPVESMTTLREQANTTELAPNGTVTFGKTGEIILNVTLYESLELVIEGQAGGGKTSLKWDPAVAKVSLTRDGNDTRQVEWVPINTTSWRIFLDSCSVELFCGEGEVVFSTRVFPAGDWKVTNLGPQTLQLQTYHLKRSVTELSGYNGSSSRNVSFILLLFTFMFLSLNC